MTTSVVQQTTAGMGRATLDGLLKVALDLTVSLQTADRYKRLVQAVRQVVPCDATTLMRLEDDGALVPVAIDGLEPRVGRMRFLPREHPRLAAILESRMPVRFAADDPRPDPFDGLIADRRDRLDVHACMGCALYVDEELVGTLTVDAIEPGQFEGVDDRTFAAFAALAGATMRTAELIEALQRIAERRGQVARELISDALQRRMGGLVGQSEAMQRLRDEVDLAASSEITVLITGETGVGKEVVARTLHAQSRRSEQPLVYVNCAALPESIAESELFGHVHGAFTGAVADRPGKFELADGGTLFLDEVGELPLPIQPKLLRALQAGEIQRVGADRNLRVDVRFVAATNRDLAEEVKAGRFRADLYHRLSAFPIRVPALRERVDDIPLLAGHFLDRARLDLGLGVTRLSAPAQQRLERYRWPGNIRELEHVILRAVLRASRGRRRERVVVEVEHLDLDREDPRPATGTAPAVPAEQRSLGEAVADLQRRMIGRAVERAGGNWAEAARSLGLDRSNLHRLARRLGLKPLAR